MSRRVKVLVGSLQKPYFRYITKAKIVFYPENDTEPHHFFTKFVEMCRKFDKKKLQEKFTWSMNVVPYRDLAQQNTCEITFLNGAEMNFEFSRCVWEGFLSSLYWQNEEIEGQRNFEGHDDEPGDEEAFI